MNCVCLKSKKDIFEDIVYHLCVVVWFYYFVKIIKFGETIKDKLGSGEVVLYFTFNESNVLKLENEGVFFEFVGKTIIGTSNVKIYKLSL